MQIDWIETFLDLCETRSFNKTADNVGITQSTVSSRIQALENTLNVKLFQRSRAGTELTTHGLKFEPHARQLRHNWFEAMRMTQVHPSVAAPLRVGIQHDLAISHIGEWVQEFRNIFPETTLYIEADYSQQMCRDLLMGMLDLAILFTPQPHPDLHFESLSEVICRMVSTEVDHLEDVKSDRYILLNLSPAFNVTHAMLHPTLSKAEISSGQNTVVSGLLLALGGTAYVLDDTARKMVDTHQCVDVKRVPRIQQSVYGAIHLRDRHRTAHRRLLKLLQSHFSNYP